MPKVDKDGNIHDAFNDPERFLVFPEKDIYTRVDVAFTQEGRGIYFFIGEAF